MGISGFLAQKKAEFFSFRLLIGLIIFYSQNIRSAVLSGIWALPTLQVTVMETIPFTFPRWVFMKRQALRGIRTLPSRMAAS